jgi:hypothetical protein
VTLNEYHVWAVRRLADAMELYEGDVVGMMVMQWVGQHSHVMQSADASLREWMERDTSHV